MKSCVSVDSLTNIVAIDGPAGAGKSTVARRVAGVLGFRFLDTGAMYRAATWRAIHKGIDFADPVALVDCTRKMQLEMREENGTPRVFVDGHDVTEAIRTPELTKQIHFLDENAEVRARLVELQQIEGAKGPTVAEGRDMGTVVFPKAKCKVYMDASLEERARRRVAELEAKGKTVDYEKEREAMRIRDQKTMTREVSPLRRADDAVLLDTSTMTLDEVVDRVVTLARAVL